MSNTNRRVTVAKTAGFCFGVNRAVNLVDELLRSGRKVCTLGPIIHNPTVINDFARRVSRINGLKRTGLLCYNFGKNTLREG